jgi:nucleoside-diphosphate-sugar epimerase
MGCGTGHSIREIAEIVCSCVASPPAIEWVLEGPTGDPVRILSIDRAMAHLNFAPQVSLSEGIRKTFTWLQKNHELADIKRR